MTIKTLACKGLSNRQTARLLGITEGAVRYQLARMDSATRDGRSHRTGYADAYAEAIDLWRENLAGGALNLALLHEWLVREHDYKGSLRSVQRYWKKTYPAPKLRARRRIETPPGAQSQVDWAHFPGVIVQGRRRDLLAFRMILSHSRYAVVVWSHKKDQLAWHRCHNEAFRRLGGVTATVRVDNEKTAVVRGAGTGGGLIRPIVATPACCASTSTPARPERLKRKARASAVSARSVLAPIRAGGPGATSTNCRPSATNRLMSRPDVCAARPQGPRSSRHGGRKSCC